MHRTLSGSLLVLFASTAFAGGAGPTVARASFSVPLGSYVSRAEVTYPAGARGPLPTVLLIHGATPLDRDATISFAGNVKSRIFAQIADALSARGFAVVRYDKRFANDPARYAAATLQDFVSDAKTTLRAAERFAQVDANRVFLYGWSEGSGVAAQLALTEKGVRGLVVQAPVARGYAETVRGQFERVTLPYLRTFAVDGAVGVPELLRAAFGPGGATAKSGLLYFWDPASTPEQPRVRSAMDANGDGRIDLDREAAPFVRRVLAEPAVLGPYAPGRALPGLIELAPRLKVPILILQGEQDANVPASDARALNDALTRAGNADHTLRSYANLGHSLGAAKSVVDDDFPPMDARPLNDIAAWLRARTR